MKSNEKDIDIEDFDLLNNLLKKPSWNLVFPKAIEALFQKHYSNTFFAQMRAAIIIGFVLLTLCGILDLFYAPSLELVVLSRLITVMPAMVILAIFAFSDKFKKNEQITLILFVTLLFLDMTWMAYKLEAPYEGLYYNGIVLLELFVVTVARIQFNYSCFVLIIFYIIYNVVLSMDNKNYHYMILMHNYIYISAAILGLFGNYFLEKSIRTAFLKRALTRIEHRYIENTQRKLNALVKSDGLTMLANHRYFHEHLEMEWRRALRYQYPLTLLMADVDFFKAYNQFYVEQQGDLLLQRLAAIFKHSGQRPGDLAARYGGDEFALLFVGTDAMGALYLANRICERLNQQSIEHEYSEISTQVTLSIGIYVMMPNRNNGYDELIKQADNALYEAKAKGGNNIVIHTDATIA